MDNSNDSHPEEENDSALPVEMQLEEVDMDDPRMDPLEWTVRKLIPIPKAYFWETGNTDLPARTKLWHRTVGAMSRVVQFVDHVGKPVVDFTGVTTSRYDYVTSTMTDAQKETARRTALERKERSQSGYSTRSLRLDNDNDNDDDRMEEGQATTTVATENNNDQSSSSNNRTLDQLPEFD